MADDVALRLSDDERWAAARVLDAAVADGRLRFAGEACHERYAGTVGGAWESGERAARAMAEALGIGAGRR